MYVNRIRVCKWHEIKECPLRSTNQSTKQKMGNLITKKEKGSQ